MVCLFVHHFNSISVPHKLYTGWTHIHTHRRKKAKLFKIHSEQFSFAYRNLWYHYGESTVWIQWFQIESRFAYGDHAKGNFILSLFGLCDFFLSFCFSLPLSLAWNDQCETEKKTNKNKQIIYMSWLYVYGSNAVQHWTIQPKLNIIDDICWSPEQ